ARWNRPHRRAEEEPSATLDRHRARARRSRGAVLRGHPGQGAGRASTADVTLGDVMDVDQQSAPKAENSSGKAQPRLGRDALVASICGFVVVLMVGASYAAVPFYNWFCRATGFNGTTQVATSAPSGAPLERTIAVRFDSNVAGGLPWKFV